MMVKLKFIFTFVFLWLFMVLGADAMTGVNPDTRLFEPKRRTVIEEGTGMWCGYCPLGIIAMKRMREKYPDDFIGIAVHYDDALEVEGYSRALGFNSFPIGLVNRKLQVPPMMLAPVDGKMDYSMSHGGFETFFLQAQEQPTVADVEVSAVWSGRQLEIHAETRFAVPFDDADFRLAFVVVEDQLTGADFYQTNYLNGLTEYTLDGFAEMAYKIYPFTFDDVAIAVAGQVDGFEGSVPSVIEAGECYVFNYNMEVPRLSAPEKARVVVMLLDAHSGEVVNANQCALTTTGVGALAPDVPKRSAMYDLGGRPVLGSFVPTLYIKDGKKILGRR